MHWKKWFPWLGWLIALVFAIAYIQTVGDKVQPSETLPDNNTAEISNVPNYVVEVLEYISLNNRAKQGYVGGRKFYNREKRLPISNHNSKIQYKEWDVKPKIKGKNRGAERLVTGDIGTAYYTKDHYKTFKQIR